MGTTSARLGKLAMSYKKSSDKLIIIATLITLSSCSGSLSGGLGGGLLGGALGPTISGTDIGNIISPALNTSAQDAIIQDTLYSIDHTNTTVSSALGNNAGYDSLLGLSNNYVTTYTGGGYDTIIGGAYQSSNGGGAIVAAATADDFPKTSDDTTITDYCSASYVTIAASRYPSYVSDSNDLATKLQSQITMENGSKLRVCDTLINRDKSLNETKLQIALKTGGYTVPSSKLDDAVRLNARREAMYVFVNSFLAFGSDFLGLMQYIGLEIPDEVAALFASTAAVMETNNWETGGINYDRFNYRPVADNKELLDRKKANTYLFVDQFINRGTVVDRATATIEYRIDTQNFCKFFLGMNNQNMTTQEYDDNLAQCITATDQYFNRIKFTQVAKGSKSIALTYTESGFAPNGLTLVSLEYNLDHTSYARFNLSDLKNFVLAVMRKEMAENGQLVQQGIVTQQRLDTVNRITTTGVIGFGSAITDFSMADLNAGKTINDSNLPAKLFLSINEALEINIPEDLSDQDVNAFDLNTNDSYTFSRMDTGAVFLRIAASDESIKLDHKRGASLYEDHLGINLQNLALQFPPYLLTEDDLFVFDISLNELNGNVRVVKPSGTLTALSQVSLKKSGVLKEVIKISNFDVQLETIDTTDYNSNPQYKTILPNTLAVGPWKAEITSDPSAIPWSWLGNTYSTVASNFTNNDSVYMLYNSPNGNYLTYNNQYWFTAQNSVIQPVYLTVDMTVASLADLLGGNGHYAGGPYNLPDEGSSWNDAIISVGNKLGLPVVQSGSDFAINGTNPNAYTGTLTCTKPATVSFTAGGPVSNNDEVITTKTVRVILTRDTATTAKISIDSITVATGLSVSGDTNQANDSATFTSTGAISDGSTTYDLSGSYTVDGSNAVSSIDVTSSWTSNSMGTVGTCTGTLTH
ncbi:MAG: hypothetical protein AB7I27_12640 [Bacteriovoracaceae bacterium]